MKVFHKATAVAVASLFALSANAAVVTKFGDDVSFTFDDATLYGDGLVVGNSIFFQPTEFRAESLNGEGAVTASETLNITVTATTSTYKITDAIFAETGDYYLSGGDASVTASGRLQLTSQTTNCETPPPLPGFPAGNGPCTDAEIFNVGGLDTVGATTEWSGATEISLADTLGWVEDTQMTMQLQNNLSATTLANGEQAWIQKKLGGVGLTVVPVPAAVWLFGSALGALGWMRRRVTAVS